MVRFKVIKGSHLLLGLAIAGLIAVIAALAIDFVLSSRETTLRAQSSFVQENVNNGEAETGSVFASLNMDRLKLDPADHTGLDIEIIPNQITANEKEAPSVLIYHTHTHEAYEQVADDCYEAVEAWRTCDQDHSVVRVGAELAKLLRQLGFQVVHDTTDHEQDDLATAYTRSLETLMSYDERFDLYIDLHRDAFVEGTDNLRLQDSGKPVARLMLLIGNGNGFEDKPHYSENLAFAKRLTERINAQYPGLCRDVLVKDGRYNQNIGVFSILVEVGHNRNTLQEALNTLPYLADALNSLMVQSPDPELSAMQLNFIK